MTHDELERLWLAWTEGDASVPLARLAIELERHGRHDRARRLEAAVLGPRLAAADWDVRRLGLAPGQQVRALRESADGRLAVVRVGEVWVSFDATTGTWGEDLEWFGAPPVDVGFWPGERWVSLVFAPDALRLVDRCGESERPVLVMLRATDTPFAVHPGGTGLIVAEGQAVYRYALPAVGSGEASGEVAARSLLDALVVPGREPLTAVAFAGGDGALLVGAQPGSVYLWSWPDAGRAPHRIALPGPAWPLHRLTVSHDGRVACATADDGRTLVVVELHAPHRVASVSPGGRIYDLATSPRGGLILASTSHAELWTWATESLFEPEPGQHEEEATTRTKPPPPPAPGQHEQEATTRTEPARAPQAPNISPTGGGPHAVRPEGAAHLARNHPPTREGRYDWQGRDLERVRRRRPPGSDSAPVPVPLAVAVHWHPRDNAVTLAMDDGWLGRARLGESGES